MIEVILDETLLSQLAGSARLLSGRHYYAAHRVNPQSVTWESPWLSGQVKGSRADPYHVRIAFTKIKEQWQPSASECSCPSGRWCKHAVALMLQASNMRSIFEQEPLKQRLTRLSGDQAKVVLLKLATQSKWEKALQQVLDQATTKQQLLLVDSQARREVQASLRSLGYGGYGGIAYELGRMLVQAQALLNGGEWDQAIAWLTGMTDAYLNGWDEIDDESDESYVIVDKMVSTWLQALFQADLSDEEKALLIDKSNIWDSLATEYEVESVEALTWVLQHGPDAATLSAAKDDLGSTARAIIADAWLTELDRQGDTAAYLAYAQATDRYLALTNRLIELGQLSDAVDCAHHLTYHHDVLRIMGRLADHGGKTEAFALGMDRLSNFSQVSSFVSYLADLAHDLNAPEEFQLQRLAFQTNATFTRYERLKSLAKDQWPPLASEFLSDLSQKWGSEDAIRILLAEDRIDDVIRLLERSEGVPQETLAVAVSKVIETHADWVLTFFTKHALTIIREGHNAYYQNAATSLQFVRDAYRHLNRESDWQALKAGLLQSHRQKRSLIPLIIRL